MSFRENSIAFAFLLAGSCPGAAQSNPSSVDLGIPWKPEPTVINGEPTVYYELHVTNSGTDTVRLKSLLIKQTSDASILASFEGDNLQSRMGQVGGSAKSKHILAPGMEGVVYLEYPVSNARQVVHEIVWEATGSNKKSLQTIKGEVLDMAKKQLPSIGAPLRGGPWASIYDPAWERGHRRVLYTVDGKARIPGRFAIDFIMVDQEGHYARNNEDSIANWFGYNQDVLSVAQGVVVAVRSDYSESPAISAHPIPPAEKATGNYITLDIGNNHFVFYEHLKPGSIRVRLGQKVHKGEVIAALGFTGQTTGPHLHFHMANRNSPLGAEGIPFVFESFKVLGAYEDLSRFGQQPWTPASSNTMRTAERPSPQAVIQFQP